MATASIETPAAKLLHLISGIRVAMLTTIAADGTLHTRPMASRDAPSIDELWFFTAADSAKTGEIDATHQVALSYAQPSRHRYIAVSGTARILRDEAKARELWNPWVEAWFPEGPTDPSLRLVLVTPIAAEYWDSSGHRMALLLQAVKAKLGSIPSLPPVDHASVDVHR